MQCPFCNKTVAKKDAYCRHCGKEIPMEAKFPPPPPLLRSEAEHSEKEEGRILAKVYRFMLGDEYMEMIAKLYPLNPDRVTAIMQEDVGVWFGTRPKKTDEEIHAEWTDFFNDPVTRANIERTNSND